MIISERSILVIGSNSFAGGTLIRSLLSAGNRVTGVSRSDQSMPNSLLLSEIRNVSNFKFQKIDINKDLGQLEKLLDTEKPEFIFDFAGQGMVAESWQYPSEWVNTNLLSKTNLLEILRNKNWLRKYVRASTPEVYGSHDDKISEKVSYSPSTPYAVSHAAIDMMLSAYYGNYGFPYVVGRFSNFYGPGQQLFRIIPKTILSAEMGYKIPLHGKGLSERSFIYSDDISSALISMAISGKPGQTYNFSSTEVISIRTLVQKILEMSGRVFNQYTEDAIERPAKDFRYVMDSTKANKDLDWKAKTDLTAGIQMTKSWYLDNMSKFKNLPLEYIHKP